MKKILIAAALALFAASPAFAATAHHHQTRHMVQQTLQSSPRLYMYAPTPSVAPPLTMDGARAQALEQCSAAANKWSNSSWETTQLATFGACMSAHGQQP